jgi:large subunit ribosomal protein L2
MYRIVDFKLEKYDIPATIETIEYDPYRSAFISLVCYRDGERRYVLTHKEASVGQEIIIASDAKPIAGNRLEIGNIPTGLFVHNVEIIVGQ